jgi:hypothetical protein
MKIIVSAVLVLALVLFQLNKELSRFFIFRPERLQELAKDAILRHGENITALLYDLNHSLREEYGEQHVMPFTTDPTKWMWT